MHYLDVWKPVQLERQNVSYCEGFCKIWTAVTGSGWIAVNVIDPGMTGSENK